MVAAIAEAASGEMGRQRVYLLVALASALTLLAIALVYRLILTDVADDAYISFRYAANLVHGNGLVFNPGEYVEGYTNFLWVMTSALAIGLGFDPGLAATALNVLFGLGLLALVGWFGGRLVGWGRLREGWQYLAMFIVAASSPLAFALISGLETVLFTLLLCGAAFSYLLEARGGAKWPLAGGLFALAALTRPEGALFWGCTVLYQFIWLLIPSRLRGAGGRASGGRTLGWLVGSFLVIWLPYIAWRVSYYGDLLPNTFYAKATGNDDEQLVFGLVYVATSWLFLFGPLVLLLALQVLPRIKRLGRVEGYFFILALVNFVYVAVAGGDYMTAYRFLLPLFPFLSLLLVSALDGVHAALVHRHWRPRLGLAMMLAAVIFLSGWSAFNINVIRSLVVDSNYSQKCAAVIDWLRRNTGPNDSLALETVGKVPYYSGIYTIDMLGLTDRHIGHSAGRSDRYTPGHNKTDPDYVLGREPTYVVVYRIPTEGGYGFNPVFHPGSIAIMSRPQFAATYANVAVFPLWPGVEGWLYQRKLSYNHKERNKHGTGTRWAIREGDN